MGSIKSELILTYIISLFKLICLFWKLVLDVDEFLIGSEKLFTGCKANTTVEFMMKDIGLMHYLLGLEVW